MAGQQHFGRRPALRRPWCRQRLRLRRRTKRSKLQTQPWRALPCPQPCPALPTLLSPRELTISRYVPTDGPFCVLCKAGAGHYYDKDDRECRKCGESTRYLTIIVALCIAVGLALIAGFLMYYCSLPVAKACKPKRRRLLQAWVAFRSLMVKVSGSTCQTCAELAESRASRLQVKITWSFYQVATLIPAVYSVEMPAQVNAVLEVKTPSSCCRPTHTLPRLCCPPPPVAYA